MNQTVEFEDSKDWPGENVIDCFMGQHRIAGIEPYKGKFVVSHGPMDAGEWGFVHSFATLNEAKAFVLKNADAMDADEPIALN